MTLLNLNKMGNSKDSNKEVPDELPSLPNSGGDSDSQTIKQEQSENKEKSALEMEVKNPEEPKLAPDELPPLIKDNEEDQSPEPKQAKEDAQPNAGDDSQKAKAEQKEEAKSENVKGLNSPLHIDSSEKQQGTPNKDRRLYFLNLIERLQQTEEKEHAEQEIAALALGNITIQLEKKWEEQKLSEDLAKLDQTIKEKMIPLSRLESELKSLKKEISEKNQRISEIEEVITKVAGELKGLIDEKNNMRIVNMDNQDF
jgi:hypothetical protein